MKKKITAAFAAIAVLLTAGCGGSEPAQTTAAVQENQPAQTTTAAGANDTDTADSEEDE